MMNDNNQSGAQMQMPENIKPTLVIKNGLNQLEPNEIAELDHFISPRIAELLVKAFGEEMWDVIAPLADDDSAQTPDQGLMQNKGRRANFSQAGGINEAELRKLMRDPRYWRDRDPEITNLVSEGFKKLYPGQYNSQSL